MAEDETYDFLRNVGNEKQKEDIKGTPRLLPTAPLLATLDLPEPIPTVSTSIANASIGHDRFFKMAVPELYPFAENSPLEIRFGQIGFNKVDTAQLSLLKHGSRQVITNKVDFSNCGIPQFGLTQISTSETAFNQFSSGQIGSTQVNSVKTGLEVASFSQLSSAQISPLEIAFTQINAGQIGLMQNHSLHVRTNTADIRVTQNNFAQVQPFETFLVPEKFFPPRVFDNDSAKVSFSSFIPTKQVVEENGGLRHLISPPIGTISLNNTEVTSLWLQSLAGVNIAIEDLPTGQLAEASITGYDSSGRPNASTLTLDLDGNGLGWFIDSTPFDNSEFSQSLTASAFKATQGSAAFGHVVIMSGTDFTNANLSGAEFSGGMGKDWLFCNTTMPDGSIRTDSQ